MYMPRTLFLLSILVIPVIILQPLTYGKYLLGPVGLTNPEGSVQGAKVTRINKGCDAERAGLRQGDIIVKINDKDIKSMDDVDGRMLKDEKFLKLLVMRNDNQLSINIGTGGDSRLQNQVLKSSSEKSKDAQFYYEQALVYMEDGFYRKAAGNFVTSNKVTPHFKDAKDIALAIYYGLGDYFFKKGYCRNALRDFKKAKMLFPRGFRNTEDRIEEAKICSEAAVGFLPFKKMVNVDIRGVAIDDVIFEGVKSKVNGGGSEFIKIIERERLKQIVNEKGMTLEGLVAGTDDFKQIAGIKYLIMGKINQIRLPQAKKSSKRKTITYKVKENNGDLWSMILQTEITKTGMYREYKEEVSITIAGSISVVDKESGLIVLSQQINEKNSDKVVWADDWQGNGDPIPASIENLFNNRQNLLSEYDLLDKVISKISYKLGNDILRAIDVQGDIDDPTFIDIETFLDET